MKKIIATALGLTLTTATFAAVNCVKNDNCAKDQIKKLNNDKQQKSIRGWGGKIPFDFYISNPYPEQAVIKCTAVEHSSCDQAEYIIEPFSREDVRIKTKDLNADEQYGKTNLVKAKFYVRPGQWSSFNWTFEVTAIGNMQGGAIGEQKLFQDTSHSGKEEYLINDGKHKTAKGEIYLMTSHFEHNGLTNLVLAEDRILELPSDKFLKNVECKITNMNDIATSKKLSLDTKYYTRKDAKLTISCSGKHTRSVSLDMSSCTAGWPEYFDSDSSPNDHYCFFWLNTKNWEG